MSEPLTITNISSGRALVMLSATDIWEFYEYNFVGYGDWNDITYNSYIALEAGEAIRIRAKSPITRQRARVVVYENNVALSGNINSMLTPDFDDITDISEHLSFFSNYFAQNLNIIDASGLELPATILSEECYAYMFSECRNLVTPPSILPASTLDKHCYKNMFAFCNSLTEAPELSATTLAEDCYESMFYGCTHLTTAPELPATTLASGCYDSMFESCLLLTEPPELPATTLTERCYAYMFQSCTSLVTPPKLPATTLAENCYEWMFEGCTSLAQLPKLPATTLEPYCYVGMFRDCSSIKVSEVKTPEYAKSYRVPAKGDGIYADGSLSGMFYNTGGTFKDTPTINTVYYTCNGLEQRGIHHYKGSSWKLDGNVNDKVYKIYYQEDEPIGAKEGDYWAYKD